MSKQLKKIIHTWSIYTHCINHFPNKPWFFKCLHYKSFENTAEKEKLLVTSNISFSHGVFYPSEELSAIFINFEIVVCKLFQLGKV